MHPYEQAILARDTIDYIRERVDDDDALEYISSATLSFARILADGATIAWEDISGVCDQRFFSLRSGQPIDLNTDLLDGIYIQSIQIIETTN